MHFTADTVVVVTGSSRGLGYQFVKQILSTTEALVVATARNVQKAAQLDALKNLYPNRIEVVQLDTSDEQSVRNAVGQISDLHSGVDLLINNAGIDESAQPIWETSGTQYQNVLNVNVVGVFLTTKAFVPLLKKKQTRTIVQISSIFASVSFNRLGITNPEKNGAADILIAYNSSKAAVNMQTSVFANALKHDDFTIVAINPGWNETDMGGPTARKLGMQRAPLQPSESILKMLNVIKGLSTKNTGHFLDLEHGDKIDD